MNTMLEAAEVFPAGEYLRDELDERGWTVTEFAEILARPVQVVSEILNGEKEITTDTALALGDALGTSPELWLTMQTNYRLFETRRRRPADLSISSRRRRRRSPPLRPGTASTRASFSVKFIEEPTHGHFIVRSSQRFDPTSALVDCCHEDGHSCRIDASPARVADDGRDRPSRGIGMKLAVRTNSLQVDSGRGTDPAWSPRRRGARLGPVHLGGDHTSP